MAARRAAAAADAAAVSADADAGTPPPPTTTTTTTTSTPNYRPTGRKTQASSILGRGLNAASQAAFAAQPDVVAARLAAATATQAAAAARTLTLP
eukprot:scaffold62689_cov41-Phaeocystis_antarctica.AAC.2